MWTRIGAGKIAEVGLEERGRCFSSRTLNEAIGFADRFIGKMASKSGKQEEKPENRKQQCAGDARKVLHGELKESIEQRLRGVRTAQRK